jgi:ABC-type Fe3+/spermidine/putrescine transport system ATPase subunit
MPFLEWQGVKRKFNGLRALDGLSFSVDEGEILGILGPSGSGKSTLLRITAGLEVATSGRVLLNGGDFVDVPPHKRGFGLMFQDYCLFPHLSVEANVGFGLNKKGWSRARREERVREMLRLVGLRGFGRRDVLTLSGGEQQRVALARSLAPKPRLLMLDEPLGALDPLLRAKLLLELQEILAEVGVTVLYVTHDPDEAMTVAGKIALVNAGRLVQLSAPEDLVKAPANSFVASFLGLGALFAGTYRRLGSSWVLETRIGNFPAPGPAEAPPSEAPPSEAPPAGAASRSTATLGLQLLVRPDAVSFTPRAGSVMTSAHVISRLFKSSGDAIRLALDGKTGQEGELECLLPRSGSSTAHPPLEEISAVWLDPARCLVLPE